MRSRVTRKRSSPGREPGVGSLLDTYLYVAAGDLVVAHTRLALDVQHVEPGGEVGQRQATRKPVATAGAHLGRLALFGRGQHHAAVFRAELGLQVYLVRVVRAVLVELREEHQRVARLELARRH